ncbi:MAG: adenosylmethionine--8-amino-7-oxononanoate transaminase [Rickettsiales bacterium]|nr:adenosylmethionine--8-amino-7-oxononanoate transaminase [Rickettsiales bacterium]
MSEEIPQNAQPDWLNAGKPHIWLPYTQMHTAPNPLPVIGAEGVYLHLANGHKLIDGISSWWSVCHGHRHPHMMQAVARQLDTLPHVMFAGLAHEPAYRLAERLAALAPAGLERVFFSDSGSTAVEVALKMAVQYWKNKGDHRRSKFVSFHHAYHGDTMGAMSLSDPENGMHHVFTNYMPKQYIMDIPHSEYSFSEFETMLEGIHKTVAGVIIEPLVQCAGGMRFHSPDILAEIHRICKQYGLLFIADEIATGFGRTGMRFACEEAGISPDMMCLGKALTGGTMTLAATLTNTEIFETFLSDRLEHALMHGPTFMANPLACASANASLDLFETEPRLAQIEAIETQLHTELSPLRKRANVKDVRVKGAIGVVELHDSTFETMQRLRKDFVDRGIWLRPYAGLVYTMPPYTITSDELTTLTDAIHHCVTHLDHG